MKPPEFKKGNKSFNAALNDVVAYARSVGVNPKGVAGWSMTPDGWQPPRIKASYTGDDMWDLIKVDGDVAANRFQLYDPAVLKPRVDPPTFLATTYATPSYVALSAACYIVANIDDLADPAIEFTTIAKATFESAGRYTFSGASMTLASIPIWYISTTQETSRFQTIRIGDGEGDVLYGVKMVPPNMLRIHYTHALDDGDYKLVCDFL